MAGQTGSPPRKKERENSRSFRFLAPTRFPAKKEQEKKAKTPRVFAFFAYSVRVFAGGEGRGGVLLLKLSVSSGYDFRHVWYKFEE